MTYPPPPGWPDQGSPLHGPDADQARQWAEAASVMGADHAWQLQVEAARLGEQARADAASRAAAEAAMVRDQVYRQSMIIGQAPTPVPAAPTTYHRSDGYFSTSFSLSDRITSPAAAPPARRSGSGKKMVHDLVGGLTGIFTLFGALPAMLIGFSLMFGEGTPHSYIYFLLGWIAAAVTFWALES
jgi:hypothetical protein